MWLNFLDSLQVFHSFTGLDLLFLHDLMAQMLRKNPLRLDPGIGFAKDLEHNLSLLRNCSVSLAEIFGKPFKVIML